MPVKLSEKVLSWASDIDYVTIEQATKLSRMPFVYKHVALMPDAHLGKGATVGSVIATEGAIIPAAVGVDIGCGMIAVRTNLDAGDLPDDLHGLLSRIEQAVPAGVGQGHDTASNQFDTFLRTGDNESRFLDFDTRQAKKAGEQFGSLGSGNHFVEVCLDESDDVWVVLHSGSRGIGNQLATQHIQGAKGLMKKMFVNLEDPDLAYFVQNTPEFDAYIRDMLWAQRYAYANRERMMDLVLRALAKELDINGVRESDRINCHHNYTEQEHHMGKNLWVTRKGAIRARDTDYGVIPGSMGAASFIVKGKGSPSSFTSASHGAGRRMSRGEAKRTLSIESLRDRMGDRAWLDSAAEKLLDEHPESYKDIYGVMEDQKDLVEVQHELRQILNYKGT